MPGLTIIYDGQCPFCASYVALLRLREAVGEVDLVDARSDDPRIAAVRETGCDLDAGMVVIWGGSLYHGEDAMHLLALLSEPGGFFREIQRRVFRSRRAAAFLYPALVHGRGLVLRLLGRPTIGAAPEKCPRAGIGRRPGP